MAEVMFHVNVPDRLAYACRLLRKAHALGAKVVVTGPAPTLTHLDRMLWTFDALDFVPHLHVRPGASVAPHLQATPVWLVEQPAQAPYRDTLINLGDEFVPDCDAFGRVIEIVAREEAPKQAARQRWKQYAERGHVLNKHEAGA